MSIVLLVMLGLFGALVASGMALVFWAPNGVKSRDLIRDISFFASQVLAAILVVLTYMNV